MCWDCETPQRSSAESVGFILLVASICVINMLYFVSNILLNFKRKKCDTLFKLINNQELLNLDAWFQIRLASCV